MDQTYNAPSNQCEISAESPKENMNENLTFTILPYDSQRFPLNTDDPDYFSALLPHEMIVYIFKFLSIRDLRNCAKVSKFWLMLSSSAVLYRDVTFNRARIEVTFLERILNCNAQSINLKFMKIIDQTPSNQLFFKTQRFNSLQKIAICLSSIQLELVEELLSSSPNLKEIKLEVSYRATVGITFFRHVVRLQFLENLDLRRFKIKDIPEIVNVFKRADKFNGLKILSFYSTSIERTFIPEQPSEFLECLLGLCPNLEVLKLPEQHISHTAFELILRMKHLKDLNIRNITLYTNSTLPITENSVKWINLRELDISHTYMFMPERIEDILWRLSPNLEFLGIGGFITLSKFRQILSLKNLKNLHVSNADLTGINSFESYEKFNELHCLSLFMNEGCESSFLSNIFPLIHYEKLRELTLENFDFNQDILSHILDMKNLEKMTLMIIKTSGVFNAGCYLRNCRLIKLNYLRLKFKGQEFNSILAEIILLSCQNVTHLEMDLFRITKGMWRSILSMAKLEKLQLFGMDAYNISYVNNSQKFPKLKSLTLSYATRENKPRRLEALLLLCSSIQDLSLYAICFTSYICKSITSMKELKKLFLTNVFGISNDKIADILNGCPKLTRSNIEITIQN